MSDQLLAVSFHQQSDQSNLKKPSSQPASKDSTGTPSGTSASAGVSPGSRWLPLLSSSAQEQQEVEEEQEVEQTGAGGLSPPPCSWEGLTGLHRPSRPQPSSMFDTGEDFDEFLA